MNGLCLEVQGIGFPRPSFGGWGGKLSNLKCMDEEHHLYADWLTHRLVDLLVLVSRDSSTNKEENRLQRALETQFTYQFCWSSCATAKVELQGRRLLPTWPRSRVGLQPGTESCKMHGCRRLWADSSLRRNSVGESELPIEEGQSGPCHPDLLLGLLHC